LSKRLYIHGSVKATGDIIANDDLFIGDAIKADRIIPGIHNTGSISLGSNFYTMSVNGGQEGALKINGNSASHVYDLYVDGETYTTGGDWDGSDRKLKKEPGHHPC
jgi:hypothetical protein